MRILVIVAAIPFITIPYTGSILLCNIPGRMRIFSWVSSLGRVVRHSPNGTLIKLCNHVPVSSLKRTQNLHSSESPSSSSKVTQLVNGLSDMRITAEESKALRGKAKEVIEDGSLREEANDDERGMMGMDCHPTGDGRRSDTKNRDCERWAGGRTGQNSTSGVLHQQEHYRMGASTSSMHGPIYQDVQHLKRRSQIVFFDLETTVASGHGDKPRLLEFGAIVLAFQGLREVQSYMTLIRQPGIFSMGAKFNLAPHRIFHLPFFDDVADQVFDILDGRIWAGHNIIKWDMVRIKEAFVDIGRRPPEPVGVIDTLPLLRESFGPRAGNFKLESLAKYCGLGKQKHRSLADVRMNMDVLKNCATMLFLESKFPHVLDGPKQPTTRSATRLLGDFMKNPSMSKDKPNWDQVIQRPSVRLTREMKRVSPIRIAPLATTNNKFLRKQTQHGQCKAIGTQM